MSHDALVQPLRKWLVEQALGNPDITELFGVMAERLVGLGIPVTRGRLIWQTLHPLFRAEQVTWNRGGTATIEGFAHRDNDTDAWKHSPMRHVILNGLSIFRRQLTGDNALLDFEMLKELKEQGYTDYVVLATSLNQVQFATADGMKSPGGVIMTWSTDRTNGFSSDDLACLQSLQPIFALACKSMILSRISGNIATTYLGQRAGSNVLNGSIRRGDGHHMSAVIWYSDLRNSTMFSESLASDAYFSLLNSFFEATAGPLVTHGGEVLDFIGDAVLGIFPYETESDLRDAAARANAALDDTLSSAREVNAERGKSGLEKFQFGVGLNVGDVKFGNIGIPQRLSFSVIGQAVNEAARIESLTKLLQQPVLAGKRIAQFDESRWRSVGAHKLDGVLDPVELFAFRTEQAA